jgi:hypothetical protein
MALARFARCLLSNCSCCCLLKAAHPEQLPDKLRASPGVPPSSCFFDWWKQNFLWWLVFLYHWLLLCVLSIPQCPDTHFSNPGYSLCDLQPRVPLKVSLTFTVLSSCSCCLLLHPVKPLPVVLSFLRCSCWIVPRPLISLMPSSFAWCLPKHSPFLGSSCNIVPAWSLVRCRNGMMGHPSAGGSQLLPGPTIAPGLFP